MDVELDLRIGMAMACIERQIGHGHPLAATAALRCLQDDASRHNKRSNERTRNVPEMIYELFPVLFDMKQRRGGDLSGGQQQQLAIGRALVLNPGLLILDEPTEGIQPNIVDDITKVIRRLNQEWGLTVLVVEQKLHLINLLADHFVLIERGHCVAKGRGNELTEELIQTYLSV